MRVVCRLDLSVCLQLMLLSEVHEAQMCVTKPYGARVRDIKCVCVRTATWVARQAATICSLHPRKR